MEGLIIVGVAAIAGYIIIMIGRHNREHPSK